MKDTVPATEETASNKAGSEESGDENVGYA